MHKVFLSLLFILFLIQPTLSQKCHTGDCQNGYGKVSGKATNEYGNDPYKYVYTGEFLNGKFHGKGELVKKTKSSTTTYSGNFINGLPHGQCDMLFEMSFAKQTYSGEFKEGKFDGYGSFQDWAKYVEFKEQIENYTGEFNDGLKDGYGFYDFHEVYIHKKERTPKNHEFYRGEFIKGDKSGYGEHFTPDEVFKGYFEKYKTHGPILTFRRRDNKINSISFQHKGKVNGYSKSGYNGGGFTNIVNRFGKKYSPYRDSLYYIGHLDFGKYAGYGVEIEKGSACYALWENGYIKAEKEYFSISDSIALGNFRNGSVLLQHSNMMFVGMYKDSKANGLGYLKYPNGNEYIGHFTDNQPYGQKAIMISPYAGTLFGNFSNGSVNGLGVLEDPSGLIYIGNFTNTARSGFGTLYRPDGTLAAQGNWTGNQFEKNAPSEIRKKVFNSTFTRITNALVQKDYAALHMSMGEYKSDNNETVYLTTLIPDGFYQGKIIHSPQKESWSVHFSSGWVNPLMGQSLLDVLKGYLINWQTTDTEIEPFDDEMEMLYDYLFLSEENDQPILKTYFKDNIELTVNQYSDGNYKKVDVILTDKK